MSVYELTLVEGGVYVGKLKNGQLHGKGILKYHDGSKYVGEFEDGKYKGVVGVGGLLLAKVPEEIAKQRQDYMTNRHQQRDEAINNDLMKEQDQRMPINVERQSRVTFGGTKK